VYPRFKASKESERILKKNDLLQDGFLDRVKYYSKRQEDSNEALKQEIEKLEESEITSVPGINKVSYI